MFSLNSINDNSFKEDIQALSFIWDRSHVVNERKQTKHPYKALQDLDQLTSI